MALSEADIELIEKHLDGNLSSDEAVYFNERMSDKEFLAELQLQKTVSASIGEAYELQLKAELKNHLAEQRTENNAHHVSNRRYWIAAAVIIVLAVSGIFLFRSGDNSSDSLFISYYKPYPVGSTTRGEYRKSAPAFEAYQHGDYKLAASLLEESLRNDAEISGDALIQLMLGNCYLNLNKTDKAKATFKKVLTSPDEIFRQEGEWYLTLTYLKDDDLQQCRTSLTKIIENNTIYSQRAQQLLNQISN